MPWQIPHRNKDVAHVFHFFPIGSKGLALHYPTVLTGDEPHYLLVINSLLEDGDLDVANNYQRAESGGCDAGFWFRNMALDRHAKATRSGHLYSSHPIGLPLIMTALAFPLRGTCWVEPLVVACCALAAILALFLMGKSLEGAGRPELSGPTILLAGLATPVFAYSRGLWPENFVVLGFSAALWLWLKNRSPLLIALIAAATIFCRYPAAILFIALFLAGLSFHKKGTSAVALGTVGGATAMVFYNGIYFADAVATHASKTGSLHIPVGYHFGNILLGLIGNLFDPVKGLLVFSPVLAFGFVGLFLWIRDKEPIAVALSCAVLLQLLAMSLYQYWASGVSYSNRYLHPAMMPLASGCVHFWNRGRSRWVKAIFLLSLLYSAALNIYAGFLPGAVYDKNPLGIIIHLAASLRLLL